MPMLNNSDVGYGATVPLNKTRKALGGSLGSLALPLPPPAGLYGQLGSGGAPTTTRTVTPLQVYQSQIDAEAGPAEGIFSGQATNLANARAEAIQRAVLNAGWTPALTGSLAGYSSDLTSSALDQAARNPMSQRAQLDRQLSEAKGNTPYDLAASGAGRSGGLAIELGNLSRQYDVASYQGMQDLLGQITGAANTYAGGYNTALGGLEAARREIADRLARQTGYSESITTTNDGGSYAPDPGATVDESGWVTPSNPNELSPSYPAPTVNQAVQRAIAALGFKPGKPAPADLYRTIRNNLAG